MGDQLPPASNPPSTITSSSSPPQSTSPIPITILTGFLGAGKTTLILNLLPQLRALNPSYTLALLKNELGDLAIDSQLASSSSISSVKELLGGCVCCNLVGSLSSGLAELRRSVTPDRIIIETSGSAFPATLAMEINRIVRETKGEYVLDGVVSVIDVENWKGYEDTSVTARLQAKFTDLVVLNKWEGVSERRLDEVLDRLGDLEVDVAKVKSDRGRVDVGVVFGIDGGLAKGLGEGQEQCGCEGGHAEGHEHHADQHHSSEVEVLSVELKGPRGGQVDMAKLIKFLRSAPKDEVYRIKAVFTASGEGIVNSEEAVAVKSSKEGGRNRFILNWAFGRWTFTPMGEDVAEHESSSEAILRMTIILAPYESTKWKKKLDAGGLVELEDAEKGELVVKKIP
ncbi:CobW/HypB/UreG, nucleotide-binding domain-containing protein [Cladorrhinum samala]|uniref:CobW/HypB/UreG, nucleotide-binding domain-containing protein n=1 Tax=Cladorrhinum samala TaxID=585594 RepID=A0AAV9HG13_9PEZI|nr:CobW/HypB/UreG, nucleotide-binding domain-containing protein [Cladorrhinum samala]